MLQKLFLTAACFVLPVQAVLAGTWDLSSEYPAGSLQGQTAEVFARAVAEKSGGDLTIMVHHGSALGYKSVDQFDAVGDGAIQAASSAFVFWPGIDPIFQLSSLPFLAPTITDVARLYDLARPEYAKALEENNQLLLAVTPWPSSGMWGNKAFETPEEIRATKVRTYDVASTETMRAVGAFPIQVAWSDVPAQLSTRAIDSVLTSANGGVGVQMWEYQSHFTAVNYAASLQGIHINRDAFDALSPETRQAVLDAAAEAEAFGWEQVQTLTAQDYATMREHGMTVIEEISPEFSAFLSDAAQPFIADWTQKTGPRAQAVLDAYNAQ
ncbi:MAG: TRAP transporter substrate-binding protein [Paracoccus sp. (in: a-proteobacteria)]|nr:TRAP transporter substrate-binding protein [Paracoccus sp. (in: a-proteobacteria)]